MFLCIDDTQELTNSCMDPVHLSFAVREKAREGHCHEWCVPGRFQFERIRGFIWFHDTIPSSKTCMDSLAETHLILEGIGLLLEEAQNQPVLIMTKL